MTVRQSEWDDTERAIILESRRVQFAPRGTHGHLLEDAMNPELEDSWRSHTRRDYARTQLEKDQKTYFAAYPEAKKDPAIVWGLELDR